MDLEILQLNAKQRRLFRHLQSKKHVSIKFLHQNTVSIQKFLIYAISPHAVLRTYAIRSADNRIIIHYNRLRRLLFEPRNAKMIRRRKKSVKQWSQRCVNYMKSIGRIEEFVETETYDVSQKSGLAAEEVSKKLKEQLELLKSGKRVVSLMENSTSIKPAAIKATAAAAVVEPNHNAIAASIAENLARTEVTPEKQIIAAHDKAAGSMEAPAKLAKRKGTVEANEPPVARPPASGGNFLDMLMNKVRVKSFANESLIQNVTNTVRKTQTHTPMDTDAEDSGEDFLGFDESEHQPGMLLTPLVPNSSKKLDNNPAFVSEALNEYMRRNNLCELSTEPLTKANQEKVQPMSLDGLVTADSVPPHMDMPAVPESLQKLRTVAERRQYLQRFSKSHKMVIINNEANIYRELQRKARQQKVKSASMLLLQSHTTQMPFTRSGWQAASYVATDLNKYYYQTIAVNGKVYKLPGTLGNNEVREKAPYSRNCEAPAQFCQASCVDAIISRDFKIVKSKAGKTILNKLPLPAVFRPCPLSQKAHQKPLDDDTAALLLAGGSMAVVSMPTIELQVYPQLGRPLNEMAKRYLQYILPHYDISREWAKFSVSTLQPPQRDAGSAAAKNAARQKRSYTFQIPYVNDRSQILVRRVVDRSEKLDESFEQEQTDDHDTSILCDLSFRNAVDSAADAADPVLVACANMLTDMINSVAISCSENSFIKEDPHAVYPDRKANVKRGLEVTKIDIHTSKRNDGRMGKVPSNKQQRLRLELRRLNATIIEAAPATDAECKPCAKQTCRLGCICDSIAGDLPLREHCGKATCVVECSCKSANHSRIMRLETDGRGISNEDAFMLRRRATARLAPMEKEFTSTVVLTGNETLLINESQRDKKRRCTKAPKRYEDFADDEDFVRVSPKRPHAATAPASSLTSAVKGSVVSIDAPDVLAAASSSFCQNKVMELRETCTVRDVDFERLKHCNVLLRRLPDMSNVVTYCMTHQLYKCFCGGDAIEGKPVVIEKEEVNMAMTPGTFYPEIAVKARYSFDKVEKHVPHIKEREKLEKHVPPSSIRDRVKVEKYVPAAAANKELRKTSTRLEGDSSSSSIAGAELRGVKATPPAVATAAAQNKTPTQSSRTISLERIRAYKTAAPQCARTMSVPQKHFAAVNRKRKADVRLRITGQETAATLRKLLDCIDGAMRYYKNELESRRREWSSRPRLNVVTSVIELPDDDDDDNKNVEEELPTTTIQFKKPATNSVLAQNDKPKAAKRPHPAAGGATVVGDKKVKISKVEKNNSKSLLKRNSTGKKHAEPPEQQRDSKTTDAAAAEPPAPSTSPIITVPRIASCYSLNDTLTATMLCADSAAAAEELKPVIESTLVADTSASDLNSSAASETSSDEQLNDGNQHFKDFYQDVVKNMNGLVSKKMQDIDIALQRDSKIIPVPNEEILCIIKWTNFVSAFEGGYVHLWEVKMRHFNFLAATLTNMMPMICGAIGVVNILGLRTANLPLLAQMVLQCTRTPFTDRLAVVMQGRKQFWLVKGFLLHKAGNACTKPTPQTHPLLTKKINLLCSLLVKQRIKEHQRRLQEQQQRKKLTVNSPTPPAPPSSAKSAADLSDLAQPTAKSSPVLAAQQPTPPPPPAKSPTALPTPPAAKSPAVALPPPSGKLLAALQSQPQPSHQSKRQATAATDVLSHMRKMQPQRNLAAADTPPEQAIKIKSNVEFRKVGKVDVDELMLPERHTDDHRWLVMDLYNDFSHIFVPAFKDMISLDRIHNVMSVARDKEKVVKLQFFQNAPYDAFVTPASMLKIYFGPLKLNMQPPLLVLLQSVDGKMMLREVYQRDHSVAVNLEERTMAFWVLHINGQVHFEIDIDATASDIAKQSKSLLTLKKQAKLGQATVKPPHMLLNNVCDNNDDDDDDEDDCMIIDDNDDVNTADDSAVAQPNILLPLNGLKKEKLSSPSPTPTATATAPATPNRINLSKQISPNNLLQVVAAPTANSSQNAPATSSSRLNFRIQTSQNNLLQVTPLSTSNALAPAKAAAKNELPPHPIPTTMVVVPTTNSVATLSAIANKGFVPLLPGVGVTTTTTNNNNNGSANTAQAAYIISSLPGVSQNPVNSETSTYLTPQVKMTTTQEPATFGEQGESTPPPSKISRISINTNSNNNNSSSSSTTTTFTASRESAVASESKKAAAAGISATTITRIGDAAQPSKQVPMQTEKKLLNGKQTSPSASASAATAASKRAANGAFMLSALLNSQQRPMTQPIKVGSGKATAATSPSKSYIKILPKPAPTVINDNMQAGSKQQQQQRQSLPAEKSISLALPAVPAALTGGTVKKTSLTMSQRFRLSAPANTALTAPSQPAAASVEATTDTTPNMAAVMYGYVSAPSLPKYVVKIVGEQHLIKVPGVGFLRLPSVEAVGAYLNSHLANDPLHSSRVPATWRFVAHQVKNHEIKTATDQLTTIVMQPPPLVEAATATSIGTKIANLQQDAKTYPKAKGDPSTLPKVFLKSQTAGKQQHSAQPADTILIED